MQCRGFNDEESNNNYLEIDSSGFLNGMRDEHENPQLR
jgi:hypothetical protein